MDHALETLIEVLGFAWICLVGQAIGLGLLSLVPFNAWLEHKDGGRTSVLRLLGGAVVTLPLGLLFTVGPWLAIQERFGLEKALLCEGMVLAAILGFVVPLIVSHKSSPPGPSDRRPFDQALLGDATRAGRTPWPRRLFAAAFPLLIVVSCGAVAMGGQLLWIDRSQVASVVAMEFLAIHAGFSLGFVLAPRPLRWPGKGLQWFFFVSILCFYMDLTIRDSWREGLDCLMALAGTYAGSLLNSGRPDAFPQFAKRWGLSLALFLILAASMRMGSAVDQWGQDNKVLLFAALYFSVLAAAEVTALYDFSWKPGRSVAPPPSPDT